MLAMPLTPPPECFAPYTGPPGGATDTGVTDDTVRVVVYTTQENDPVLSFIYGQIGNDDTPTDIFETYEGFNELLGSYMETYGRTVELVRYNATGPISDAIAATTDAETIARDLEPFAVLGGPNLTEAFAETLAANEVLCISCTPGQTTEWYEERGPYVGDVQKNSNQSSLMAAEYVGKRLADGDAEFGGDEVRDQPRRFGLIYLASGPQSEEIREELETTLADEYGVTFAEVASYPDPISLAGQARELLARMESSGVTTILYSGDPLAPQTLTENATAAGLLPGVGHHRQRARSTPPSSPAPTTRSSGSTCSVHRTCSPGSRPRSPARRSCTAGSSTRRHRRAPDQRSCCRTCSSSTPCSRASVPSSPTRRSVT